MMWDLQEMAHSDGGSVLFAFPSNLDAHSSKLHGAVAHTAAPFNGARLVEQVCLAFAFVRKGTAREGLRVQLLNQEYAMSVLQDAVVDPENLRPRQDD